MSIDFMAIYPIISGGLGGSVSAGLFKEPINSLNNLWVGTIGWKAQLFKEKKLFQKQILFEKFVKGIGNNISTIAPQNIQLPDERLASNYFQASEFCISENELRYCFAKLIANTLDKSKNEYLHPAFGDILKQMSSLDARLFKQLFTSPSHVIAVWINHDDYFYLPSFPVNMGQINYTQLDNSIRNLKRLELISIPDPATLTCVIKDDGTLSSDVSKQYIDELKKKYCLSDENIQLHQMHFTSFGKNLYKACVE